MEFNLSIRFGDDDAKQGRRGQAGQNHMSQSPAARRGNDNDKVLPFTPYKFILRHPHEATAEDILSRDNCIVQAGAGSWLHAACHLITAVASPAALAPLPFAIATLGWPAGVGTLATFALISLYCSMCLASLWEWDGVAYSSYRDLVGSLFGKVGYYVVVCLQGSACFGKSVIIQIATGKSIMAINNAAVKQEPRVMMMLRMQECMAMFGVVQLGLSQFPTLHCMRWLNVLCSFNTVGFTALAIGTLVSQEKQASQDITLHHQLGKNFEVLAVCSALGSLAFSFSDALLPEIQSTLKAPVKQMTMRGLCTAYIVILSVVGIIGCVGSWALGAVPHPYFVESLGGPFWQIVLLHSCGIIQLAGCYQMYCQPMYSLLETKLMGGEGGAYTLRNCLVRFFATSLYTVVVTLVATCMPFFGSLVCLVGAFGFTLLDIVLPSLAALKVQGPKMSLFCWVFHIFIAIVFILVALVGSIGALRYLACDLREFGLFNNKDI